MEKPFGDADIVAVAPTIDARIERLKRDVATGDVPSGPLVGPLVQFELPTPEALGRLHATISALGAVRTDEPHEDGRPSSASIAAANNASHISR